MHDRDMIHAQPRSPGRKLLAQILAFSVTGVANTALGLLVIMVMMLQFGLSPWLSNILGYAAGLCLSFVLNRWWTFREDATGTPIVKFLIAFAIAYVANLAVLAGILAVWPESKVIAQICALATYSVLFFILSRLYVFRQADDGRGGKDVA